MKILFTILFLLVTSVAMANPLVLLSGSPPAAGGGADYAIAYALVRTADVDGDTGVSAKICIHNSSGSLIATSSEFSWSRNTTISAAITGATLTPGAQYAVSIISNGYFDLLHGDSYGSYTNTTGSYASPPTTITFPAGDGGNTRGPFAIWITNASSQQLIGNSNYTGYVAGDVSATMELVTDERPFTCSTL